MKQANKIIPVILSGGSGSRLWPLTRENQPKQFLKLFGKLSLLQNTLERVLYCTDNSAENVITVTNNNLLKQTCEQYLEFEPEAITNLIGEPSAQNTAAAIAYSAFHALEKFGANAILWIVPADHHINNIDALKESINHAQLAAEKGYISTFGITPTSAETAYGYIKKSHKNLDKNYFSIESFIEKPDKKTAKELIKDKNYFWNSGMFTASVKTILSEFSNLSPQTYSILKTYFENHKTNQPISPDIYKSIHNISFDKAIMEKTKNSVIIPCDIEWSDIGTWGTIWEIGEQDKNGNVTDGRVATIDSKDCIIHSNSMLIATIGLKDLAIIENGDSILIADKNDSSSLKKLVSTLKNNDTPEIKQSPFEKKPWGNIKTLSNEKGHCVKELTIEPKAKTSLHMHRHRCEFWTVIEGDAEILLNKKKIKLSAQDTLFIPINSPHKIKNIGKIPLKIIEVQCGDYLDEDDIIRLDDSYRRDAA